jgi:hypothetical protein
MTLLSGTPLGNVIVPESIFVADAPTIFIQDASATVLKNPDADGFYWGLSGTSTYPVYELGCLLDVSLTEDIELNDIRCDDVGVKATIQQRNSLSFRFTVQSFFPLSILVNLLKGGAYTLNAAANEEKFGLGKIDNNKFWHVYAPNVYDQTTGDILLVHIHRAQFVGNFTVDMRFGNSWQLTGLELRGLADTTKPSTALFSTILRNDASVL